MKKLIKEAAVVLLLILLIGCGRTESVPATAKNVENTDTEDNSNADQTETEDAAVSEEETWRSSIEDLPEDFIFRMDASSVLAEENSGVKYYDFGGNEQDVFKIFADAGINYIT